GTLVVATDAGDREELSELHAFQASLGLVSSILTGRECRSAEPLLSPAVQSGLLVESDHSVDNRKLGRALLTATRQASVRLITTRCGELIVHGDRVTGVRLEDRREVPAGVVVLAAGPWSAGIDGLPPHARPPVRPVKGHILRLRATSHTPLPTRSIRGFVNGTEVYLVPRTSGELVVGATVEEMGFDTTVRAGAVRELLRDARAVVPLIDEFVLEETTTGLRPGSPDNAPIIGEVELDGLIVATGHHRNGVLLTPITADLVTGLVVGETAELAALYELCSPGRFATIGAVG
ncbi:MAG TPA: FAD-dependent oxidoreductase, partial [Mycobacteriales bacterium]|nr:FAD-dependent oxidoreductase [Mycobacteriales bacterium]